jgi:hypothetical protein
LKLGIVLFAAGIALAQEAPGQRAAAEPSGQKDEAHEGPSAFEAEFAASDVFRSGSYIQPLWRGLGLEGHYFGGTSTETGFVGGAWTFRLKGLKLSPGFGVMFGSNQFATAPAFSFRWDYERGWFVSQGLTLQGFRETPVFSEEGGKSEHHDGLPVPVAFVRPTIADGDHVSARWKRLTIGGTWEHIHFREGDEWKGGGRLAIRLLPRVSAILYVLGPGRAEWRGGVLIHPRQLD